MATPAVQTAVKTAKAARLRPVGKQKIYLPSHVITFIRPKPNQPANHATFVVPLTFNKLDLRDYLFHGYNVSVKGVRSFINHIPVKATATSGWSRGMPQKMMIADLVQPFHWPKPPAKDDREQFDYEQFATMDKWVTEQRAKQEDRSMGKPRLVSNEPRTEARRKLRLQMFDFLKKPDLWTEGGRPLEKIKASKWTTEADAAWEEVEEDIDLSFDEADAEAAEKRAEERGPEKAAEKETEVAKPAEEETKPAKKERKPLSPAEAAAKAAKAAERKAMKAAKAAERKPMKAAKAAERKERKDIKTAKAAKATERKIMKAEKAVGRKAVGRKAAERKPVGMKPVGRKAAGSKAVGMKAAGSKAVGMKAVGGKAAGSKAKGVKPVGRKAAGSKAKGVKGRKP